MIFFMSANADTPVQYNAEQIYERSENAIFYIRVLREDGSVKSTGTGVLLSQDGLAATAYHVVKGAERIDGAFNDGRIVSTIEVLNVDEEKDIAILKLPDPQADAGKEAVYEALEIRENQVKHGEKMYAIGYPLKNTPIITEGIINSPKAEINGRDRILTSVQVVSGMSGGPIIDIQGRLIGIISGSLRTMNNIHLVVDIEDLRSLLPDSLK
ncbi:MAG: trypsin-like serine protease with C-terminal domain [Paenibacillus sp.]|jgi:S1-C subfamily serine protease|nr:trypsin-like serine protease with C-terminal domain [Paenibacillus sp.]